MVRHFRRPMKKVYKRRPSRRFLRHNRPHKSLTDRIYTYRQFCYTVQINQNNGSDDLAGTSFVVSGMPNWSDLATLYDQYRVNYCEHTFYPTTSLADQYNNTTSLDRGGLIYVVIDKDDATPTGTLAQLQQYQNVRTFNAGRQFVVRYKPGVRDGLYNGSAVTQAGTLISPWIDCTNNNIPHFGIKMGITAGNNATSLIGWRIDLYVSISFKGVR